jgi:phage tail sheath protein FI
MPTQLSPGVNVTEIDLTTIVPAVATSEGAIGGVFRWGPIAERVLVDNEQKLVTRFGKPTSLNAETFFTAASFLAYGNRLYVSRAANTSGNASVTVTKSGGTWSLANTGNSSVNATAEVFGNVSVNTTMSAIAITGDDQNAIDPDVFLRRNVLNEKDYIAKSANGDFDADTDLKWIAKYPGDMGDSLKISVCDSADAWYKSLVLASNTVTMNSATSLMTGAIGNNALSIKVVPVDYANGTHVTAANTRGISLHTDLTVGDLIEVGNNAVGKQMLRIVAKSSFTPAFYNSTFSFDFVANATSIEVTSGPIASITVGSTVEGTSIPAGTTVVSKNASHIVISNTTTSVDSGTYIVKSDARFTVTVNNKIRIKTAVSEGAVNRYWEYFGSFDKAPGQSDWLANLFAQDPNAANGAANDALHAVVVDNKGLFSGVPGTILERFANLSRVVEAKDEQGSSIYYKDAINNGSQYVWWANDEDNAPSANAIAIASSTNTEAATYIFVGGKDGLDEDFVEEAVLYDAYDQFMNSNEADISLVLQGKARGGDRGQQLGNYIIDNICEHRKDCVAFLSPNYDAVINNIYQEVDDVVAFRNAITSSSYGVIDSGYKYMYDRYNDVYRWVPLNGDIAGLCARTDDTNDPWFSPAGYNRGIIKNVVKLAYNPSQAERDSLYKSDVNPVINIQGAGTLLYGDKTVLGKPSAFDRINVRRLFIVLEKAISLAAKYTLFEFNDAFTRTQFRNLVEPYLRDVQGRRGIFDFKVVCDETNNTPEIIDRNEFVGDIYIKPARSINFIQLNFIAVRTGVAFNEIIGLRQ